MSHRSVVSDVRGGHRTAAACSTSLVSEAQAGSPAGGRGDRLPLPARDRLAGPPADFGPWQTVWKRHRAWSGEGIWDRILDALLVRADARGELDWSVAVDSTICRAHQHGTNLERTTGGAVEPQGSPPRAG